jgi:adenylate cyclase
LANSLGYELIKAEAEKGARSKNPDAVDLAMRGRVFLGQLPVTRDDIIAARAWFDQALKIDPNEADALASEAYGYMVEYAYGWTDPETDYEAKILGQAARAILLSPGNLWAYYAKSQYLYLSRRPSEALGAANAGLAIDPNYAPLLTARSSAESSLGHFEQAKADVQEAMRLSPREPYMGLWRVQLGDAELGLGHFGAAIGEYQKAIDSGFRVFFVYSNQAAAYALEGKTEDAKSALTEARRLNPKLTVQWLIAHSPNLPPVFEGLRKAGLPEE